MFEENKDEMGIQERVGAKGRMGQLNSQGSHWQTKR